MRALVWIAESTWQACIKQARELVPEDAEITLLHVAPTDVEELAAGGRAGLLGRHPPPSRTALRAISDQEAQDLLATARTALGRPCDLTARRGRVEREVVKASANADILVLARDSHKRLGPKSLRPQTRFVVDHAPCTILLGWGQAPPDIDTIPPPPRHPRDH